MPRTESTLADRFVAASKYTPEFFCAQLIFACQTRGQEERFKLGQSVVTLVTAETFGRLILARVDEWHYIGHKVPRESGIMISAKFSSLICAR